MQISGSIANVSANAKLPYLTNIIPLFTHPFIPNEKLLCLFDQRYIEQLSTLGVNAAENMDKRCR